MRIVYLHYHLEPGGVTTVLRQQVASMTAAHELLVLSGSRSPKDLAAPSVRLRDLAYDSARGGPVAAQTLADRIDRAIRDRWPAGPAEGGCDLIHVHNPTLVKNQALLDALEMLQGIGYHLLLQIHDFAEDGRPDAYTPAPYPADCHYAVINLRDHGLLLKAGLRPAGCHLLPNMVSALPLAQSPPPTRGQVLYPVRAIRRKNIGEALLLSLFLAADQRLGITLPPTSPADRGSYRMWTGFAADLLPTVAFEVGLGADFRALVQAAPFLITTSITEGFGFGFVEPWTAGRGVWGRRLSAICGDFQRNGLDLGHMYTRLGIPLAWIDAAEFGARWLRAYVGARRRFGLAHSDGGAEQALASVIREGWVDLGLLHEGHQKRVIERLVERPAERRILQRRQPALARLGTLAEAQKRTTANRQAVLDHYGPAAYGRRLEKLYGAVQQPVRQRIDKTRLCDAFLRPSDFSLLKWSPYED